MPDSAQEAEARLRAALTPGGGVYLGEMTVHEFRVILEALTDLRERLTETEAKLEELRDLENARLGQYIEQDKRLSLALTTLESYIAYNERAQSDDTWFDRHVLIFCRELRSILSAQEVSDDA